MAVLDVRIDDRLIHGQVCGYWIPHFQLNRIVIVDDEIVKDSVRKTALKFGCPAKVALAIISADSASEKFKRQLDKGSNVMILTSGPAPILKMIEAGYEIKTITVGNMSAHEDSKQIKKTVFVSDQDIEVFQKLAQHGVKLISQMTPSESRDDFTDMMKNYKLKGN